MSAKLKSSLSVRFFNYTLNLQLSDYDFDRKLFETSKCAECIQTINILVTQIYGFCHLASCLEPSISDTAEWMRSNRLQLNADKTEIIWCTSSRRQHQIPTASFAIGADVITPVSLVGTWEFF